eukprot:jgi/Bigna1/81543/fgenesh1_pg.81_\
MASFFRKLISIDFNKCVKTEDSPKILQLCHNDVNSKAYLILETKFEVQSPKIPVCDIGYLPRITVERRMGKQERVPASEMADGLLSFDNVADEDGEAFRFVDQFLGNGPMIGATNIGECSIDLTVSSLSSTDKLGPLSLLPEFTNKTDHSIISSSNICSSIGIEDDSSNNNTPDRYSDRETAERSKSKHGSQSDAHSQTRATVFRIGGPSSSDGKSETAPNASTTKKQKPKRERNREAASKYRKRRKAYVEGLEGKIKILNSDNVSYLKSMLCMGNSNNGNTSSCIKPCKNSTILGGLGTLVMCITLSLAVLNNHPATTTFSEHATDSSSMQHAKMMSMQDAVQHDADVPLSLTLNSMAAIAPGEG